MKFDISNYWKWAHSDLLSNAERGLVAEYLVMNSLSVMQNHRVQWDAYDVETAGGMKVEVKASGYLQSWPQAKQSTIRFGIKRTLGWSAKTNITSSEKERSSDVYVFCLHAFRDKPQANPLDTEQWKFYVLSTLQLNNSLGSQKTVGISTLNRIGAVEVGYAGLAGAIETAQET